jgi:hypothetical protein
MVFGTPHCTLETLPRSTPRLLSSLATLKEKSPAALAAIVAMVPVVESAEALHIRVATSPPIAIVRPPPLSCRRDGRTP